VSDLQFEWDERKNVENQHKHGVSFEEAQTLFLDDYALLIDDPDHSRREERFILLGRSAALRHVVVCHCYLASSTVVRIISARKATATERETYRQWWKR
jgi:uncharacterized DUF497 family protein